VEDVLEVPIDLPRTTTITATRTMTRTTTIRTTLKIMRLQETMLKILNKADLLSGETTTAGGTLAQEINKARIKINKDKTKTKARTNLKKVNKDRVEDNNLKDNLKDNLSLIPRTKLRANPKVLTLLPGVSVVDDVASGVAVVDVDVDFLKDPLELKTVPNLQLLFLSQTYLSI